MKAILLGEGAGASEMPGLSVFSATDRPQQMLLQNRPEK